MTYADAHEPKSAAGILAAARRVLICLGLALAAGLAAAPRALAETKVLYDDPRVVEWAGEYIDGKQDEVLTNVEADLKSETPSPLSTGIWTAIHFNRGDLKTAAAAADPVVKRRLGALPDVTIALRRSDYRKVMDLWAAHTPDDANSLGLLDDAAVAAEAIQDFDALFEITELLLARFPNAYLGILYVENDQRDLALRNRYLSLLTFGELASNSDFKMAEARLLDRHGSYADNLAESAAFLANHLSDDEAEWTNANALYDLERFAEAADAYEKEYRAFPFATNLAVKAAWVKALAREEKYDQAKSVAGLTATADSAKIRPVDATAEIILIQGELNAGEKGEARREFEKAIARFPKDPVLQDLGAQIENSSNRPEQAAEHARIAVASDPTNIDYQSHLIQALAKTDGDAALTQFHRALQTVPSPTYSFYYLAASVYSDRKDWRAWTDLWQQAVQLMPHEYNSKDYLARGLAEQGQTQAAFEALRALLQYHTADSWEASHYREYATATMKADLARSAVEQLRLMQPWNQALWSDAASDLAKAKDDAGIDALWAKALASNPTAAWAYEAAIDHLIEEKHWDQANALLGEMNRRQASVGLKEKYVEEHAYFVRERAKEAPEPRRDQLTALTRELDQNRDILGEYSYWWWIWQTGIAAQDEAQRHQGLTRLMECSPDLDKVYDLFDLRGATETDRRKLDRIRRHAVWRYMDRDPYNPAKLETFGERHSQWLGDDVGGLWAYERIEEIDPDYAKKNGIPGRINDNYERLGDSTRALKDYLTYGAIANSDRYLGWFASARAQAEKQLGRTHLEFDPKTVRATITDTDGETVVIEANLRWGKAALLQRGPNWVRATYDDYGNLTSVSNNGGHRVDLVYDNQDRISMMKGAGGGDLRFTYNAHGKPIVMEITGKGRIDVTYDDQDNITKVESDAGRAIALEVTTRFQNLTDLIRPFSNLNVNVVIPSLSTADPEVEDLRQTFKKATRQRDPQQIIDAGLALSGKLVAKIPDQSEYAREAEKVLSELLDAIEQGDLGQSGPDAGVRALALWRELFKQSGRVGLSKEQWEEWFGYRDFFARLAQEGRLSDQSRATLAALVQPPLTLLPSAQWLPSDNLSNPGLWSRVTPGKMVLAPAAGGDLSAVLVRQNGDVVAAGASGLFVRRRGYWRFYHFDAAAGRFSMDRSAKSDPFGVLSLAEDANGALWIGAKSGVIRLDGDYDDAAQVWRSDAEKPFEAAFLILFGDGVLAGGADGLRRFDGTGEKPVVFDPRQAATPVKVLRALPDNDGRSSEAIVGNAHGVFRIGEEATTLSDAPVDDLLWTPSEQLVFELKGGEVWISHWRGKGAFEPAIRLADIAVQGDLGTPGTLTEVPVEGADSIPALLTDKGVALWAYDHLELLAPPGLALGKKIVAIGGASPRLWLATGTAALLSFGTDNVISSDTAGQVYDIIALPAQTAVVIARGENGLQVSRDGRLPEDLADTASTVLANDAAGRLIANDNMDIVRFSANLSKKETLFSAEPSQVPQPQTDSQFHKVSSLLVASDGAIWATAGPSVFRWQDGKVKEFSMFLDSKFFSAKSDAMSRVIETIDHHIWVVASNEGHRRIGSDYLNGGLFEYTPAGFRSIHVPGENARWFITGYTKIGPSTGIVGTSGGFYLHRSDRYEYAGNDPSYAAIWKDHPALYLGGRGARLADDTWLFGTADGVVGLHEGKWFRPAQLNAVLPDFPALPFGGTTVHAIETDAKGRVYVGTDLGLLIYDTGGDGFSLEANDGMTTAAMEDREARHLAAAAGALPSPVQSAKGQKVEGVVRAAGALKQEVEIIRLALVPGAFDWAHPETAAKDDVWPEVRPAAVTSSAQNGRLEKMRADRQRALDHALALLKADAPEFYDEIKLPTASADAVWKAADPALAKRAATVEYALTPHGLFIRLSTADGSVAKSVNVEATELLDRAKAALAALHARGGVGHAALQASLAWLYDVMLRPIEPDLAARDVLLVVPDPRLADLPLAALLRDATVPDSYAVRRFVFAYLPSLQSVTSMMATPAFTGAGEVVKIDGTDSDVAVPATASDNLAARPWADVTLSGALDLTAGRELALFPNAGKGFDLAILSSGKFSGVMFTDLAEPQRDGALERDALALALARGRTVDMVLPLWPVATNAANALSTAFFDAMRPKHLGPADALADAQRAMLQSKTGEARDVRSWASFIVMGRP